MSSAVKSEVGCSAGGDDVYGVEVCNHGFVFFLGGCDGFFVFRRVV